MMTDDLIARLRGPRTEQGGYWPIPNLHEEAADALEAKDKRIALYEKQMSEFAERSENDKTVLRARIAALEAALKPFADAAGMYDMPEYDHAQLAFDTFFIVSDLRAARAALESKE